MDELTAAAIPISLPAATPLSKEAKAILTHNSRHGTKNKAARSLSALVKQHLANPDATMPDLIPPDGVYHIETIQKILGVTRQALCYHTRRKDPLKRLNYVLRTNDSSSPTHIQPKKRGRPGRQPFYVTAVDFLRFLIGNNYQIPPAIHKAVENYSRHYGTTDYKNFYDTYQTQASGTKPAEASKPYEPPPQARLLPKPINTFTEAPKITIAESTMPGIS